MPIDTTPDPQIVPGLALTDSAPAKLRRLARAWARANQWRYPNKGIRQIADEAYAQLVADREGPAKSTNHPEEQQ